MEACTRLGDMLIWRSVTDQSIIYCALIACTDNKVKKVFERSGTDVVAWYSVGIAFWLVEAIL
jgi:hypothetical protein